MLVNMRLNMEGVADERADPPSLAPFETQFSAVVTEGRRGVGLGAASEDRPAGQHLAERVAPGPPANGCRGRPFFPWRG